MPIPGVSLFGADGVGIGVNGAIATIPGTGVQAPQATTNVAVPANAANVTVRTGADRRGAAVLRHGDGCRLGHGHDVHR